MASEGKTKLSAEELFAQLNDPALVRVAAERLGLKIADPEKKVDEEDDLKKSRPQPLTLPEDAKLSDFLGALNKFQENLIGYVDTLVNKRTEKVHQTLASRDKQSQQATIAKAISNAKAEIGEENLAKIMPTWNALVRGGMDIADAFAEAKSAKGITSKKGSSEQRPTIKASAARSDESEVNTDLQSKPPKTTKEAIARNLDKLIAEQGEDWLDPEGTSEELVHAGSKEE